MFFSNYNFCFSNNKIITSYKRNSITCKNNIIFRRFIANQDNIYISKSNSNKYYGYAPIERSNNARSILIGSNGFVKNGMITIDPTFYAIIILHEGLHQKYQLISDEGKISSYPTLAKHMYNQKTMTNYQGEHESMAEGNIALFVIGMKEFDKNYGSIHSEDWYNAMAWMGSLKDSYAWYELNQQTRDKYETIINNELRYIAYLEAVATFRGSPNKSNRTKMLNAMKDVNWNLYKSTRTQ